MVLTLDAATVRIGRALRRHARPVRPELRPALDRYVRSREARHTRQGHSLNLLSEKVRQDPDGDLQVAVLARALWDGEAAVILADQLEPQDFISETAKSLFVVLANAAGQGKADPVSIGASLRLNSTPDVIALYEQLLAYDVQSVQFEIGAEELAEAFQSWSYGERFRQLIAGAQLAIEMGKPIPKIERRLEERLIALQTSTGDDRVFDDAKTQSNEVLEFYCDTAAKDGALTFGFEALDRELLAPRPGNLFVLAGPTGAGKSTVAGNIVDHWSERQKGVLFSLEMSALEQRVNMACRASGVPVLSYYKRTMSGIDQVRFSTALGQLQWGNLVINERAHLTPDRLLRAMARYLADGCRFFVIDHLHRLDYGAVKDSDLRIPVGNLAQALKNFAMTHKVVVLALAQVKKQSPHDEPDDSSIRETAKIAEEADGILFVYRPLVACTSEADGTLRPMSKMSGGRFFEHERPRDAVMGADDESVYIKPGKFRVSPITALFRIPFDKTTGKMSDRPRTSIV